MRLTDLETFFENYSFLFLFISTISCWIQVIFFSDNKSFWLGSATIGLANGFLTGLLYTRWIISHHPPFSNLFESIMLLSWALTWIHLWLDKNQKNPFMSAITAPSSLLINAFGTLSLSNEMQKSSALVPALQSNWLIMHVTIMILSYAALLSGCIFSITFLVLTYGIPFSWTKMVPQQNFHVNENNGMAQPADQFLVFKKIGSNLLLSKQQTDLLYFAKTLDNLSYRTIGIGFPLLTMGILSGAVWANEAWGSYWSWDPKETWALITWMIFAIYLHTRITKGWQGKKPAIVACLGFFVVWICYLGVNLLGKGLHSYGWFQ
uniref:cytochrome c biogenesis protein n=1 Tax=Streptofilum capillatum TaxID=2058781 RepID=UPI00286B5383|nr:cytochrome c biogenesis protein [Streptofilum capillatum]WKT08531.1 cytochrome c biogenesis protein [Streptofilum capillatum]WKT08630.1 cytochrome c biogenesis protein [Streptofilum sp. BC4-VF8pt]WKT08729.1 cytochrome c biogenesis protein [Streptofilum sp. ZNP2-VF4pt]